MSWHTVTARVTDCGMLPPKFRLLTYQGQELRVLLMELASTVEAVQFQAREPVEHAILSLIHVEIVVGEWPSSTSCEVFGKAEQGFLRQMIAYARTLLSSGKS